MIISSRHSAAFLLFTFFSATHLHSMSGPDSMDEAALIEMDVDETEKENNRAKDGSDGFTEEGGEVSPPKRKSPFWKNTDQEKETESSSTSCEIAHKVKRKPPLNDSKVLSMSSLIEEVAVIYGFLPLPYSWLPLKNSYPKTSKLPLEKVIEDAAQNAANREEFADERIKAKVALYKEVLSQHVKQMKEPIDTAGTPWIHVVASQLKTEEEVTDKRLRYAPGIATNDYFDLNRFIAHRAIFETELYRKSYHAMKPLARKNVMVRWQDRGVVKEGIRIPLDNKGDTSCIPYSIVSSLRNKQLPRDPSELNNEVAGLRMSIAEYISSAYVCDSSFSQYFSAYRECHSHCEHLKGIESSGYYSPGAAFQKIDLHAVAIMLKANIHIFRPVAPCTDAEYDETVGKGVLKVVPHHSFMCQGKAEHDLHLLYRPNTLEDFFSPFMNHCEPIIKVRTVQYSSGRKAKRRGTKTVDHPESIT